jgi:hypothetical protein
MLQETKCNNDLISKLAPVIWKGSQVQLQLMLKVWQGAYIFYGAELKYQ